MQVSQAALDQLTASCDEARQAIAQANAAAQDYANDANGTDDQGLRTALLTLAQTERVVAGAWQTHIGVIDQFMQQVKPD